MDRRADRQVMGQRDRQVGGEADSIRETDIQTVLCVYVCLGVSIQSDAFWDLQFSPERLVACLRISCRPPRLCRETWSVPERLLVLVVLTRAVEQITASTF